MKRVRTIKQAAKINPSNAKRRKRTGLTKTQKQAIENRVECQKSLLSSIKSIPKGQYSLSGLSSMIVRGGILKNPSETRLNEILKQPKIRNALKKQGITITIRTMAKHNKNPKLKEQLIQTLIKLNKQNWPGFPKDLSPNSFGNFLIKEKKTDYKSSNSIRFIIQDLIDKDKIRLP